MAKTYNVRVTIQLAKVFEIEAEDAEEAADLAIEEAQNDTEKNYWDEDSEYETTIIGADNE